MALFDDINKANAEFGTEVEPPALPALDTQKVQGKC